MKNLLTVIFVIFLSIRGICQETPINNLIKSIKKKDTVLYKNALESWAKTIPSWSNDTLEKNELLKNLNEVISLVYSEEHSKILKLSYSWWDKNKEFVMFNNNTLQVSFTNSSFEVDTFEYFKDLRITLNDSLGKSALYSDQKSTYFDKSLFYYKIDTLINIKPKINVFNQKSLILTDTLENDLNNFLRKRLKKYKERRSFLYSKVSIIKPFIQLISFSPNFKNCIIKYRWELQGGFLIGKKVDDKWIIINSEISWIY